MTAFEWNEAKDRLTFPHVERCVRKESGMKRKQSSKPRTMSRSMGKAALGTRSAKVRGARIDTSEIPPLTDEFFRRAIRNPFYRPVKQSTTVRIDADILAWLKSQGPGYQTRINALLRAAMDDAIEAKPRPG